MFATCQNKQFGEALWIEFAREPVPRLSQRRLAAEFEELEVELSTLERRWRR